MLNIPTPFPEVGSFGFMDDRTPDGRDVIEPVRILSAPDDEGDVLISMTGRRFPREIASGNRRVPLAIIRETERAAPVVGKRSKPAGRTKGARR